jgi:hypothetical protein
MEGDPAGPNDLVDEAWGCANAVAEGGRTRKRRAIPPMEKSNSRFIAASLVLVLVDNGILFNYDNFGLGKPFCKLDVIWAFKISAMISAVLAL